MAERRAPGQFGTASPKSAIVRVWAASRPLERRALRARPFRNSQVSSEWKRTAPRRGEPEPWCSTTIQPLPLRSSFAT